MSGFDGIPMAPDAAREFLDRRTSRSNAVDRSLVLLMAVRLAAQGFKLNGPQEVGSGVVGQIASLLAHAKLFGLDAVKACW